MKGRSRHVEIMRYIKTFQTTHYRMPTRKEIEFSCKIGRGALQRIIGALEEKKQIKRVPKGMLEFRILV